MATPLIGLGLLGADPSNEAPQAPTATPWRDPKGSAGPAMQGPTNVSNDSTMQMISPESQKQPVQQGDDTMGKMAKSIFSESQEKPGALFRHMLGGAILGMAAGSESAKTPSGNAGMSVGDVRNPFMRGFGAAVGASASAEQQAQKQRQAAQKQKFDEQMSLRKDTREQQTLNEDIRKNNALIAETNAHTISMTQDIDLKGKKFVMDTNEANFKELNEDKLNGWREVSSIPQSQYNTDSMHPSNPDMIRKGVVTYDTSGLTHKGPYWVDTSGKVVDLDSRAQVHIMEIPHDTFKDSQIQISEDQLHQWNPDAFPSPRAGVSHTMTPQGAQAWKNSGQANKQKDAETEKTYAQTDQASQEAAFKAANTAAEWMKAPYIAGTAEAGMRKENAEATSLESKAAVAPQEAQAEVNLKGAQARKADTEATYEGPKSEAEIAKARAESTHLGAETRKTDAEAQVVVPKAQSEIGLQRAEAGHASAEAGKAREEARYVGPKAQSEIGLQRAEAAHAGAEAGKAEEEARYLGPKAQAEIGLQGAQAAHAGAEAQKTAIEAAYEPQLQEAEIAGKQAHAATEQAQAAYAAPLAEANVAKSQSEVTKNNAAAGLAQTEAQMKPQELRMQRYKQAVGAVTGQYNQVQATIKQYDEEAKPYQKILEESVNPREKAAAQAKLDSLEDHKKFVVAQAGNISGTLSALSGVGNPLPQSKKSGTALKEGSDGYDTFIQAGRGDFEVSQMIAKSHGWNLTPKPLPAAPDGLPKAAKQGDPLTQAQSDQIIKAAGGMNRTAVKWMQDQGFDPNKPPVQPEAAKPKGLLDSIKGVFAPTNLTAKDGKIDESRPNVKQFVKDRKAAVDAQEQEYSQQEK